ncbi:signal peptide peptidase SppA [Porticoccaceae bacterium]|nr:signal peptide peptidase SppA [Porticoccaceae bacterium]MDA8651593.1 signal peptide peptidase SppA [Porticoccaceae bacterium]
MSEKKPGIISRLFGFLGKILTAIRHLFTITVVILLISGLSQIASNGVQPIPEEGALYLAPSGVLVDQKTLVDPIEQLVYQNTAPEETLVRDIVDAVNYAQEDDRITHIILDTDYMSGASLSKLQEVGSALKRFKDSGKPIIAVADNYDQNQYFLAAHADTIMLNPLGSTFITGLSSYRSYFKEALDKLNITVNIFRVGQYKSAVEPLMRNSMSNQVKEEAKLLLDDLWQFYTTEVETLRKLDNGAINYYVDNSPNLLKASSGDASLMAKDFGLVDSLVSRSEIRDYLNTEIPGEDGEYTSIDMGNYLANKRIEDTTLNNTMNRVAVITASGAIMDGQQPEGSIGGDTLANIFNELKNEDTIKAVVLRIDSGGGSAFASEIIRDAIRRVQDAGLPVVVSMSSVAASGGYWIAAEADSILALPTTITGSIGVFGIIPTIDQSLAKLGVYSDGVGTSTFAGMMNIDRPLNEQVKQVIQLSVDDIYARFLTLVAKGRHSTTEEIHKIAQGRVWTGNQALENGLIDQLGDLDDAISVAAELADLDDYQIDFRRKQMDPFEAFISQLNANIKLILARLGGQSHQSPSSTDFIRAYAEKFTEPLLQLQQLNDPKGIYLYCEKC